MLLALQITLSLAAILLATWANLPCIGIAALGMVCGCALLGAAFPRAKARLGLAVIPFIMVIPLSYFFPKRLPYTFDTYFAWIAWLLAGISVGPARPMQAVAGNRAWNVLAIAFAFVGACIVGAVGYDRNEAAKFYGAVFLVAGLIVVTKRILRPRFAPAQFANTALILLVGLPLADAFVRPAYLLDRSPDPSKKYYSFESARKDPSAFRRWWYYYVKAWGAMGGKVYMPDTKGVFPFRLRPESRGKLFNSSVSINSRGFRGKEIAVDKGNAYRIVILGESTTFGATMNEGDKPWPEILEGLIRDRLKPARPVEVINAGVPAYTILHTLARMKDEIVPLKPDMLITYHGYNGFGLLESGVSRRALPPPPAYVERPAKLLAGIEYNFKLLRYKSSMARSTRPLGSSASLLDTPYGKAYRDLFTFAQTNGIRLCVANFSMAVTTNSPRDMIEFYRSAYPSIYWQMDANLTHTALVEQLANKYPAIARIDMHPGLDGQHEKFLDLVHMTEQGREQAAENAFAAIKPMLEKDLGRSGPLPSAPQVSVESK